MAEALKRQGSEMTIRATTEGSEKRSGEKRLLEWGSLDAGRGLSDDFRKQAARGGMDALVSPRSIAVVGATNRRGSIGLSIFRNLIEAPYQGILYPVNRKARSVQGVKAYPTLSDIPDDVDMAVIIVPADYVPSTVEEASRKGVKACTVITAGFKEVGGDGVRREDELKALARAHGIRLLGPNCLGIINTHDTVRMNASFARVMPKKGNIALVSQSGAMCLAILDFAAGRNMGFSKSVSIGNKADVNEIDFLRYLKDDPETDVIIMYLEDIVDGRAFMEIAREITFNAGKPIFALKVGRSEEGARAAASHTGSLAGSDASYDAILMQSGIQRVEGVSDLFDYAQAFSMQPLPKGNRIAIITNSGGPGIMATDALIRPGLKLANLSEMTRKKLMEHLPTTASVANPVDVIGDAGWDRYEAAVRYTLMDEGVDGAIVILTPAATAEIMETAQIVPRVAKEIEKPILCSFMGLVDVSEGVRYLEQNGIPNFAFPEAAARTMAAMVSYREKLEPQRRKKRGVWRLLEDPQRVSGIIRDKLEDSGSYHMPEREANEILRCYGFPLLKSRLVREFSEIEEAVKTIGFPVVMKIDSPNIIHKSDAHGVQVNIRTIARAQVAFEKIIENAKQYNPSARINGVLIEQMAGTGLEVILGASRDPKFGPICMFGLGGVFVEALKDVTFRLAPMWQSSAENMVRSIKAYQVLKGIRGNPPSDIKAVTLCLLRLSAMVSNHPEIKELDINPLIVYPKGKGCAVADSRIILSRD